MKKLSISIVGLYLMAATTIIMAPSCDKKDEVKPTTVSGVSFSYDANLTNESIVLTSNRSEGFASGSLGSYYNISGKTTGNSDTAANSDFKLFDSNTSSSGTPSLTLTNDGTKATKFSSTALDYATARAGQVDSAVAPSSSNISIVVGTTYLFMTADNKKGLIKIVSLTDAVVKAGGSTKNATLNLKIAKKN